MLSYTGKHSCTSIGSDSGHPQKCKKSALFKSWAFITSDMEVDDNAPLEPPTNNNNNKETKGGKLPSIAIYGYPPSQNIGTLSANDPESPCECCFKVGQECFGWKGWACYNCKTKKIQFSVKIYNRWKCETNASLQSGELPPSWLQWKTRPVRNGRSSGRPEVQPRIPPRQKARARGKRLMQRCQRSGSKVSYTSFILCLVLTF